MAVRCVAFILTLAFAALCVNMGSTDKTAEETSSSLSSLFESINEKFQNATKTVEGMLGVDIPSTQEEVQTALRENIDGLKQSAQKLQQKLSELNVTSGSVSEALQQVQAKVDTTVKELAQRNPDLGQMLEQAKTGYANLVEVGKKMGAAVQEQAGGAQVDLQAIAEQAKTELTGAAKKLETKVQELVAAKDKKSS